MENDDKIILIYTGDLVTVEHLKVELEAKGIFSMVENGYQQGMNAGFAGGIPSAINLFVSESDVEKAFEIIKAITE